MTLCLWLCVGDPGGTPTITNYHSYFIKWDNYKMFEKKCTLNIFLTNQCIFCCLNTSQTKSELTILFHAKMAAVKRVKNK